MVMVMMMVVVVVVEGRESRKDQHFLSICYMLLAHIELFETHNRPKSQIQLPPFYR